MVINLTMFRALRPFLAKPKDSVHLTAISRELEEPHPTVRQWLSALEAQGVVKKTYKGRMTLYSLNLEHPNIIDYLVIEEKNKVLEKCNKYLLLREVIFLIRTSLGEGAHALIFGSAAEDFSNAEDIDLLVIGLINKKKFKAKIQKVHKEIHLIQVKSFKGISETLKVEIMKKHLIIQGGEEIMRWLLW